MNLSRLAPKAKQYFALVMFLLISAVSSGTFASGAEAASTYTVGACTTSDTNTEGPFGQADYNGMNQTASDWAPYACANPSSGPYIGRYAQSPFSGTEGQGDWGWDGFGVTSLTPITRVSITGGAISNPNGEGWAGSLQVADNNTFINAGTTVLNMSGTTGYGANTWTFSPSSDMSDVLLFFIAGSGNDTAASGTYDEVSGTTLQLEDPNTTPTLADGSTSGTPWSDGSTTKWYSGAGFDSYGATASSTDDGGTCYLYPTLTPTSSATNGGNTVAPSVYSSGGLNDTSEYVASATDPDGTGTGQFITTACTDQGSAATVAISNLAAVPSGSYYLNVQAQNPAQFSGGAIGTTADEGAVADSTFLAGSSPTSGEQLNIDNVSPTAAWNSTSTAYSSNTTQQLNVTVGSSGMGSLTCSDNGSSVTPVALGGNPSGGAGTYRYNVPTAAQGANAMSCVATNGDSGSALSATTSPQTFNVDTTSPTVTVPATNSSWISSPASLAVSASTSGPSAIASITCSDSNNANTYTVNASSGSIPTSDETNGTNTWTCRATSGAGLTSATKTVTEKLDTTSPGGTIGGASAGTWVNSAQPLSVTATVGDSGVNYIDCSDSNNSNTVDENGSATVTIPASAMTNGVNIWSCQVMDNAGATTNLSATEELDTATPTMTVPTTNTAWVTTAPALALSASDGGGPSGIGSIICSDSIGSGSYLTASSSGSIPASSEANGANLWTCSATNNAGTSSAPASVTVKLDGVNPTVSVASTTGYQSTAKSLAVTTTSGPSGIASITCANSNNSNTYSVNASSGAIPASDMTNGTNSWTCSATNNAGVTSANATGVESLDTVTPTITLPASSGTWQSVATAIPVSASGGSSGIASISCTNSNNSDVYTVNGDSGSIPADDQSNGANTWSCDATNNAGASGDPTVTELLDTVVPTVTLPPANSQWVTTAPSLSLTSTVGDSGISSVDCSNSLNGDTFTTTNLSATIPATDETNGANSWSCVASNNAGVSSDAATDTVNLDTTNPTLSIVTDENPSTVYPVYSDVPRITTNSTVGASGIESFSCLGDNVDDSFSHAGSNVVSLASIDHGPATITCSITANNGQSASQSFNIDVEYTNSGSVPGKANIQGTVLSINTPPEVSFSGELDGNDLSLNDSTPADQSLVATDATGSFNGWNITAYLNGQFADGGGASLPANALSLNSSSASSTSANGPSDACVANSTCTVAGDPSVDYPIAIPTSSGSGATVYDAAVNTGMGSMGVGPFDWWLNVPGNTLAGVYTTQVIMSINSGPSS